MTPFPGTVTMEAMREADVKVLFQNQDIAVVDKPAGVAVHEGESVSRSQSLISTLEAHFRSRKENVFLVHRLDRETSGCLLIVKRRDLVEPWEEFFREGRVEKEYLALIKGRPFRREGVIERSLPGRGGHLVPAVTRYRVEFSSPHEAVSCVRVRPETGRKHQIRLHFSGLGFPLVMDPLYGDFAFNKHFRRRFSLKRMFLHALSITFPLGKKRTTVVSPLAEDLAAVLESLHPGFSLSTGWEKRGS